MPSEVSSKIYKSLCGVPANTDGLGGEGQFITNDGMFINIQNSETPGIGIQLVVDVNGYQKGPNVYGRDTFAFDIIDNKIVPMGAPGTRYSQSLYCSRVGADSRMGLGCTLKAIQGESY